MFKYEFLSSALHDGKKQVNYTYNSPYLINLHVMWQIIILYTPNKYTQLACDLQHTSITSTFQLFYQLNYLRSYCTLPLAE